MLEGVAICKQVACQCPRLLAGTSASCRGIVRTPQVVAGCTDAQGACWCAGARGDRAAGLRDRGCRRRRNWVRQPSATVKTCCLQEGRQPARDCLCGCTRSDLQSSWLQPAFVVLLAIILQVQFLNLTCAGRSRCLTLHSCVGMQPAGQG